MALGCDQETGALHLHELGLDLRCGLQSAPHRFRDGEDRTGRDHRPFRPNSPTRQKEAKEGGEGGDTPADNTATPQHPAGCTTSAYAEAKQLRQDFLRSLGLADVFINEIAAVKIPYLDAEGAETAVRFRVALSGKDKFLWRKGSKALLYGLDRIDRAREEGTITIVEGESDCHTLWNAGFAAVGLPGAGNWDESRDAALFDGFSCIYVVIEPDSGGEP
jgi:hypothetical protein